jgi:hypothetical protein
VPIVVDFSCLNSLVTRKPFASAGNALPNKLGLRKFKPEEVAPAGCTQRQDIKALLTKPKLMPAQVALPNRGQHQRTYDGESGTHCEIRNSTLILDAVCRQRHEIPTLQPWHY